MNGARAWRSTPRRAPTSCSSLLGSRLDIQSSRGRASSARSEAGSRALLDHVWPDTGARRAEPQLGTNGNKVGGQRGAEAMALKRHTSADRLQPAVCA